MTSLLSLLGAAVPSASAAFWEAVCSPLQPGCGQGPANIFATTLPNLAVLLLQIATALAVLFIIVAGVQMTLNLTDEGKVSQQKTAIFYALAGLFVAITSQLLVSFVASHYWGQNDGGNLIIALITSAAGGLLTIFNGIFVLVIIYYCMRMLMATGDSGAFSTARTAITWAIVGAIIVNLANALVQGVTSFFAL